MESSKTLSNLKNYSQENTLMSTYEIGESCLEGGKEGLRRHQRTYSDSMLCDQQQEVVPYWLKDLLDEDGPTELEDKPLSCKTHRRSSSDSIAYVHNNTVIIDDSKIKEQPSFQHHQSRTTDSKRGGVKRHSAQQYRARKVQYIAELERGIQSLQAEGYEVSAELEFLDQQNLILGMENRALKQRLDSLSQEHFVKCLEQEMLEREITRLRNLYQQQQHKQHQQKQNYGRNRSKRQLDIDSSIAKFSLKNKGTESHKVR
ncbi:uncharacterized protein [Cicer arietinum]|uniref:Uncharacterized protein LOC101493956 n=1 Tax=Cicer arietinum TaxID=3827 RepID=A0A3Q7YFE9_CICAR|nr:uncharacterized protein LOC101493956 [Cicer arietinum]XP_027190371.1 uncharacterized protein LOC101493956 [Cicer arietinum]